MDIEINILKEYEIDKLIPMYIDLYNELSMFGLPYKLKDENKLRPYLISMLNSRFANISVANSITQSKVVMCGFIFTTTTPVSKKYNIKGGIGTVHDIYVPKLYREQGIASALLEHTIKQFKKNNLAYIELSVLSHNTNAINLYKKMGFEPVYNNFIKRLDYNAK